MKTAFVNAFPNPKIAGEKDWVKKLEYLGDNTGNYVYVEELRKQINYDIEAWLGEPGFKTGEYDAGIIPVSTILKGGVDCAEVWAPLIKDIVMPITLAGVCTQSSGERRTPKEVAEVIPKEQIKAFQEIAEQAHSIGIRGAFTAEVCELLGVHNYRIIGCPSYYQWYDGEAREYPTPELKKVTFTLQARRSISGKVYDFGRSVNGEWILQERIDGPELIFEKRMPSETYISNMLKGSTASKEDVMKFAGNMHMFFSVEEWKSFLRSGQFTFSFGMRFHGNMMAHLTGIPTLWIAHDSRTRELVETLKLPHISVEEFKTLHHVEELLEKCDYSEMYKNYGHLCRNYVEYLEENNIKHNFHIH